MAPRSLTAKVMLFLILSCRRAFHDFPITIVLRAVSFR